MKVSPPSELNCRSMLLCITRIAVITTMMENTPTSTPSSVSAERSLCAAIAPKAMRQLSRASIRMAKYFLLIAQSIHGVHARGPPRREKTGQHARHRRDQERDAHDERRHHRRHRPLHQQGGRPRDERRDDAANEADAGGFD